MKTLVLKDLARLDELDRAASLSVRGGTASLTRQAPSGDGGLDQPMHIERGWSPFPPVHFGCGPVYFPFDPLPSHKELKVVPL